MRRFYLIIAARGRGLLSSPARRFPVRIATHRRRPSSARGPHTWNGQRLRSRSAEPAPRPEGLSHRVGAHGRPSGHQQPAQRYPEALEIAGLDCIRHVGNRRGHEKEGQHSHNRGTQKIHHPDEEILDERPAWLLHPCQYTESRSVTALAPGARRRSAARRARSGCPGEGRGRGPGCSPCAGRVESPSGRGSQSCGRATPQPC